MTITDDDPPEVEGDSAPAYVEGGTGPVATYTASNPDPRNISIRWGLEGADKDAFTISNGVLRFTASPDYEDPNNLDNEYAVTVQATASDEPLPGPLVVTVTIEDALGMVRLLSNQPQLGRELTARVSDPDEVDTATTEWCWERSLLPAFPRPIRTGSPALSPRPRRRPIRRWTMISATICGPRRPIPTGRGRPKERR